MNAADITRKVLATNSALQTTLQLLRQQNEALAEAVSRMEARLNSKANP